MEEHIKLLEHLYSIFYKKMDLQLADSIQELKEYLIDLSEQQASVEPEVMQKIAEIPENLKVRFMIVNHKTNSISCHWLEPSHEGQIIGNDEMQIENIRFELE